MDVYAAGAAAAFTVDVLVYPLDTLKTRYQSKDYLKTYAPGSSNKPLALRGLYQGISSVVLATLPAGEYAGRQPAGLFSTYEKCKDVFFRHELPLPDPMIHSLASAVAEMASCMVITPAEVVKQNAQMLRQGAVSQSSHHSASLQALRQLTDSASSRRLFRGYTVLVARNLPFTALQFPLFEKLRSEAWLWRRRRHPNRSGGLLETALVAGGSAGVAGAFAAFLTTPGDVVKTRMMVTAGSKDGQTGRLSTWEVTRQVYRERGIRDFFRGGLFRSSWTALGSSLYLGTYDMAKVWLKRRPSSDEVRSGL